MVDKTETDNGTFKNRNCSGRVNFECPSTKYCKAMKQRSLKENVNRILSGDEKSKSINVTDQVFCPTKCKNRRGEQTRLSLNILQAFIRYIYKIRDSYENINEIVHKKSQKTISDNDLDVVIDFFEKLRRLLIQMTKTNGKISLNNLFGSLINKLEHDSNRNRTMCKNVIVELLKSEDIQLKSRKIICMENSKIEEITFFRKFIQNNQVKENINTKPFIIENPMSYVSIELPIKENIQNFRLMSRKIVDTHHLIIHKNPEFYKAIINLVPSSTPELWKFEIEYSTMENLNSNPLKYTDSEIVGTNITDNIPVSEDKSSLLMWKAKNLAKLKTKDDMYRIYSCLKSIESLMKYLPKNLLKRALELDSYSLYSNKLLR